LAAAHQAALAPEALTETPQHCCRHAYPTASKAPVCRRHNALQQAETNMPGDIMISLVCPLLQDMLVQELAVVLLLLLLLLPNIALRTSSLFSKAGCCS
jgi:hypothetical protein